MTRDELLALGVGQLESGDLDLRGIELHRVGTVAIHDACFDGAKFTRVFEPGAASAGGVGSVESSYDRCSFRRVDARKGQTRGSYTDCSFDASALSRGELDGSWTRCSFAQANLEHSRVRGAFRHCVLSATRAKGASFADVTFHGCELTGTALVNASFERCLFEDCRFSEIDAVGAHLIGSRFVGTPAPALVRAHLDWLLTMIELRSNLLKGRGVFTLQLTAAPARERARSLSASSVDVSLGSSATFRAAEAIASWIRETVDGALLAGTELALLVSEQAIGAVLRDGPDVNLETALGHLTERCLRPGV